LSRTPDSPDAPAQGAGPPCVFQRITHPWSVPEDDFWSVAMVLLAFPVFLPLVVAIGLPILAVTRLKLLKRLTLLDFMLFMLTAGNLWGLCVRFIGWEDGALIVLILVSLEGLSATVVGAGWGIRTAEALEQRNLRRAATLLAGMWALPLSAATAMLFCDRAIWGSAAGIVALVLAVALVTLLWGAALSLHEEAARRRRQPTLRHLRELALEAIARRRSRRPRTLGMRKAERRPDSPRPALAGLRHPSVAAERCGPSETSQGPAGTAGPCSDTSCRPGRALDLRA